MISSSPHPTGQASIKLTGIVWASLLLLCFAVLPFTGNAQNLVVSVTSISNTVPQWTNPSDNNFTVSVGGSGSTYGYWFVTSNRWFDVGPSSGTSTGEADTIVVSYNAGNMDMGTYTGSVMVVSPNATNSPKSVPVYLTVAANAGVDKGVRIKPFTNGIPGRTVNVPVQLVSTGNVNAVGCSLVYDRRVFRTPQILLGSDAAGCNLISNINQSAAGRVGFVVSRPNQTTMFASGTRELAVVTLSILGSAFPTNYGFCFTAEPIVNEISGTNAMELTGVWPTGMVRIVSGIEADVMPRDTNDFSVTVSDWTQVGRFVAGLDSTSTKAEYQRTDCAPRNTWGDGQLGITDWVQAGRYAAALDTSQRGDGPYMDMNRGAALSFSAKGQSADRAVDETRYIYGNNCEIVGDGEILTFNVMLNAWGNENALGFSINYDPDVLSFIEASLGEDASGALLLMNDTMTTSGTLGVALGLPVGQTLDGGTQSMIKVTFRATAGSDVTMTPITFSDTPVKCELASSLATVLPTSFADASNIFVVPEGTEYPYLKITGPTADNSYQTTSDTVDISGYVIDADNTVSKMTWSTSRGETGSMDVATMWTKSGIPLLAGENVITASAENSQGATDSDSITVTYSPQVGNILNDYNGDGVADLAVYDQASGAWYIRGLDGELIAWAVVWGGPGLDFVPGDYDGDGCSDMAVYSEALGTWYIRTVGGTVLSWAEGWGGPGFSPVPGDFDGDDTSDMAVFHEASGTWYIRQLAGTVLSWGDSWGGPGFSPVSGDYNGNGNTDLAVYHEATGTWYIRALDGSLIAWANAWGGSGFYAVAGDYDGDGNDDQAVFHEATGTWYIKDLEGDLISWAASWGGPGFTPVSGDCNGDGKADLVVYHELSGTWYAQSLDGQVLAWGEGWGGPGLIPAGAAR